MGTTTKIGWCDATINFWHGCQKVSEGCKYCYMYRDKEKFGQDGSVVIRAKVTAILRMIKDLHVKSIARRLNGNNKPLKIFTCSWSDFFLDQADAWREDAWNIIRNNPEFIWIILTKRPERIKQCLPPDWGEGWKNVWLCVSAENQERWNERVPILLDVPAKIRGVSAEPLIGAILPHDISKLDWVVIGGESGNDKGKWLYRPCSADWIKDIVDFANEFNVPVFVKQLGTHQAKRFELKDRSGSDIDEFPDFLWQIKKQQFPGDINCERFDPKAGEKIFKQ